MLRKDTFKTDVIFRVDTSKDFEGTVFALFPYDVDVINGLVVTYQHIGQHSYADYKHCLKTSRRAKLAEFKDLRVELEGLGYNIRTIKGKYYKTDD